MCPHGQKFHLEKKKPFSFWVKSLGPSLLLPRIAKNASFSPALLNLWLFLLVVVISDLLDT